MLTPVCRRIYLSSFWRRSVNDLVALILLHSLTERSVTAIIPSMSDKRTQIIEASIDLFANNGFWNTPTSKITKHAGVSTGTLFNYFDSKDALIDQVYLQLLEEMTATVSAEFPQHASLKARSEHIWFRYLAWGVSHPVRFQLLQQMKLSDLISPEAHQRSLANWTIGVSVIVEGVEAGLFQDVSAEFLANLTISQLNTAVHFAIDHELSDMPLNKHIARSFDIYWKGVTT